jgi:hypothetical protein
VFRHIHRLRKLNVQKARWIDTRNFGCRPLLLLESTFGLLTKSKQIGKVICLVARKMNVHRVGSF